MKLSIYFSTYFKVIIIFVYALFVVSCSEEGGDDLSSRLVGKWSISNVNINVEVDAVPIDEYLKNGGLTEAQQNELEDYYQSIIDDQTDDGDIELKSDYTYVAYFGNGPETGSWSYNEKTGDVILMPADDILDSSESWKVLSVSSVVLIVSHTEVETEDLNDDGTDEKISINTQIKLEK